MKAGPKLNWLLVLLAFLLPTVIRACPFCGGTNASIGDHPDYYLGNTDQNGCFQMWFKLTDVNAGGVNIPLYVSFDSKSSRANSVFGRGWYCPFLESHLLPVSETVLSLSLLGGGKKYLFRTVDPKVFSSKDAFWKAVDRGQGRFEVSGPGHAAFTYVDGRIQDANLDDSQLHWNYVGTILASVGSSSGRNDIIDFGNVSPAGNPKTMQVNGRPFEFHYQNVPAFANANGVPAIASIVTTLEAITDPDGTMDFSIQAKPDGTMEASIWDNRLRSLSKYTWDGVTGHLESDDKWKYSVIPSRAKGFWIVQRRDEKGNLESFEGTPDVTRQIHPDGSTTLRYFMNMAGPAYNKPRKIDIFDAAGKLMNSTKWSYNEKGQLIRLLAGAKEWEWTYDSAGRLLEMQNSFNGKQVSDYLYDEAGRITQIKDGGNLYKYKYAAGGEEMERYLDGKLIDSMKAASDGIKRYLSPKDGNGVQPISNATNAINALASGSIDPLDAARILAKDKFISK